VVAAGICGGRLGTAESEEHLQYQTIRFLPWPMLAGLLIEAKPLWQGGPYQGTLAVLVGVMR
jgi:hypothetical protein